MTKLTIKLLCFRNKSELGIFPKSYIQLLECILLKNEYIVKRSEIVNEITTVLGDWGEIFRKFYLSNHDDKKSLLRNILALIRLRSQILSGNLPVDEMKEVKLMATSVIDTGNQLLRKNIFIYLYLILLNNF